MAATQGKAAPLGVATECTTRNSEPRAYSQEKLLLADEGKSIYFLCVFSKQIPKLFFGRRHTEEF